MGNWSKVKVLRLAKGFTGRAKNCYSLAIVRLHKSLQKSYSGRKLRRRTARKDWIVKINAALSDQSIKYSHFINGLNVLSNVILNRKILAELATNEPYSFRAVVNEVAEQAGIPRIPLPKMSYEEAKVQGEIVDTIPKVELKEPELELLRVRPGITPTEDYLRLTHKEEDAIWRAKRLSKIPTKKQMKKLPAKLKKRKVPGEATAGGKDAGKGGDKKDAKGGKGDKGNEKDKGKAAAGEKGKGADKGDKEKGGKDKSKQKESGGDSKGKK